MCDKMKCFENYDYKFISNMIENKVYKLKKYEDYNKKYKELFDRIDNLEATLSEKQKDDFISAKYNELTPRFPLLFDD